MPASSSQMLQEIEWTLQAFGETLLEQQLSPVDMNSVRNCQQNTPYALLCKSVDACRMAVQAIRKNQETINNGLQIMDDLYSENKMWDDRTRAFLEQMYNGHPTEEEAIELLNHDHFFANMCDDDGYTPLMWASYNGHMETVKQLVEHGASLHADLYTDGNTPLLMAIEGGHADIADYLLECEADPCQARNDRYTPLMAAAEAGFSELASRIINEVLMKYDNLETYDYVNRVGGQSGLTALMWALDAGKLAAAKAILYSPYSILASHTPSGYTAVTYMAAYSTPSKANIKLFKDMLYQLKSAELDQQVTREVTTQLFETSVSLKGYTALLHAVEENKYEMAKALLDAGANPNIGAQGYTPLMAAHGDYGLTSLLLKAGADVDARFENHAIYDPKWPIHFAEWEQGVGGGAELIDIIMKYSAAKEREYPPLPRSRANSVDSCMTYDDMPPLVSLA